MMHNGNQNDFILKQIEMFIKAIKALIGSLLGKSEEEQKKILKNLEESGKLDEMLKDLTGLNDSLLNTSPDFLLSLLKDMCELDENRKAMLCLSFYLKKEERYKKISQALLETLNVKIINKKLRKLLEQIIYKEKI